MAEFELPELPEGMFWRVGEDNHGRHTVFLMGAEREVVSYRYKDIYGTGFWDKNKVVDREVIAVPKMKEPIFQSHPFDGFICKSKDDIPEFGEYSGSSGKIGSSIPDYVTYRVPVNPQGIAFVAGELWKSYNDRQKFIEDRERTNEEARSYFGDYPPRTLS